MGAITPKCLEDVAQSYAKLILAGQKTIDDVPQKPKKVYDRVVELISEDNSE